jgi:phosphate transport system permease protein
MAVEAKNAIETPSARAAFRRLLDSAAEYSAGLMAAGAVLLTVAFGVLLYWKARPIFEANTIAKLLFSSVWAPSRGEFGFYAYIMGTLWVTALAMLIAAPLSLLTAIYLAEYAPRWIRSAMEPVVDLLAGVPSVVYGVWGVVVVVPFVRDVVGKTAGKFTTGYSVLAGGIVLALMVIPIMVSVMQEVLRTTPMGLREVSFSLGATRWETVRRVVCRRAGAGLVAAVILALSRAFGETMAVLMVVGNVPASPRSILDPAYPLPALIANNYGEMMSVKLYDSALMTAALILMAVVLMSHIAARLVVMRLKKK